MIRANAENGGIKVLLVHPNVAGHKLAAEKALLEELPADAKAVDIEGYALFWRGRDRLRSRVAAGRRADEAAIYLCATQPLAGLTLEFQRAI